MAKFVLHFGIGTLMTLLPCLTAKPLLNEFLQYFNSFHNSIKFTIEFEQDNEIPFFRHDCQTLLEQHFHDIHLPEKGFHRPLHQMGFVHSTQIQNKYYPHAHLSLLPNLLLFFSLLCCNLFLLIFENICFKMVTLKV